MLLRDIASPSSLLSMFRISTDFKESRPASPHGVEFKIPVIPSVSSNDNTLVSISSLRSSLSKILSLPIQSISSIDSMSRCPFDAAKILYFSLNVRRS